MRLSPSTARATKNVRAPIVGAAIAAVSTPRGQSASNDPPSPQREGSGRATRPELAMSKKPVCAPARPKSAARKTTPAAATPTPAGPKRPSSARRPLTPIEMPKPIPNQIPPLITADTKRKPA
ncbi:MAG: hypothetical protein IPM79_38195 [Polyangiaceae bacterium]|nr:hypothetical protein [Polyangiaceae bacterium]